MLWKINLGEKVVLLCVGMLIPGKFESWDPNYISQDPFGC